MWGNPPQRRTSCFRRQRLLAHKIAAQGLARRRLRFARSVGIGRRQVDQAFERGIRRRPQHVFVEELQRRSSDLAVAIFRLGAENRAQAGAPAAPLVANDPGGAFATEVNEPQSARPFVGSVSRHLRGPRSSATWTSRQSRHLQSVSHASGVDRRSGSRHLRGLQTSLAERAPRIEARFEEPFGALRRFQAQREQDMHETANLAARVSCVESRLEERFDALERFQEQREEDMARVASLAESVPCIVSGFDGRFKEVAHLAEQRAQDMARLANVSHASRRDPRSASRPSRDVGSSASKTWRQARVFQNMRLISRLGLRSVS